MKRYHKEDKLTLNGSSGHFICKFNIFSKESGLEKIWSFVQRIMNIPSCFKTFCDKSSGRYRLLRSLLISYRWNYNENITAVTRATKMQWQILKNLFELFKHSFRLPIFTTNMRWWPSNCFSFSKLLRSYKTQYII